MKSYLKRAYCLLVIITCQYWLRIFQTETDLQIVKGNSSLKQFRISCSKPKMAERHSFFLPYYYYLYLLSYYYHRLENMDNGSLFYTNCMSSLSLLSQDTACLAYFISSQSPLIRVQNVWVELWRHVWKTVSLWRDVFPLCVHCKPMYRFNYAFLEFFGGI